VIRFGVKSMMMNMLVVLKLAMELIGEIIFNIFWRGADYSTGIKIKRRYKALQLQSFVLFKIVVSKHI
jgi:hypothetical protein